MVGETVAGRYRLVRLIGRGGMGEVHEALQIGLDRAVAVKMLTGEGAGGPADVARLLREARTCASLDHPAILSVYEAGYWEGRPFIAMEYVDGADLCSLMDGGLEPRTGVGYLVAVAEALAAAHAAGVVHRDLKGENVLVARDGRVKVGDWGLARVIEGGDTVTGTGLIMGTPHAMAPEQILGRPLTAATDLYAFGVLLFQVASGRLPFTETEPAALLRAHLEGVPPLLAAVAPGTPRPLSDLAGRLLAKDPRARPSSAAEVVTVLRATLADWSVTPQAAPRAEPRGHSGVPTAIVGAAPRAPSAALRAEAWIRRRLAVAAVVLLVLLAVVGTALLVRVLGTSGAGGGGEAVAFRGGTLLGPDEVELRFSGSSSVPVVLRWLDEEGREVPGQGPRQADPASGEEVSPGLRRLIVRPSPPVRQPLRLVVGEEEGALGVELDPAAWLARFLAPLSSLTPKGYDELWLRLFAERGRFEEGEPARRRALAAMDAAGLDETWRRRARAALDDLFPPDTLPRGPLVEGVLRLWALDSCFTLRVGERPPWGSLSERLGVVVRTCMLNTDLVASKVPDGRILGMSSGLTWRPDPTLPGGQLPRSLRVFPEVMARRIRANPERELRQVNRLLVLTGEALFDLSEVVTEVRVRVPVAAPAGAVWPPRAVRLSFAATELSYRSVVQVGLGRSIYTVAPTGPYFAARSVRDEYAGWYLEFPVDPSDVTVGDNEVAFRCHVLGAAEPRTGIQIVDVTLSAPVGTLE